MMRIDTRRLGLWAYFASILHVGHRIHVPSMQTLCPSDPRGFTSLERTLAAIIIWDRLDRKICYMAYGIPQHWESETRQGLLGFGPGCQCGSSKCLAAMKLQITPRAHPIDRKLYSGRECKLLHSNFVTHQCLGVYWLTILRLKACMSTTCHVVLSGALKRQDSSCSSCSLQG